MSLLLLAGLLGSLGDLASLAGGLLDAWRVQRISIMVTIRKNGKMGKTHS